MIVASENIDQEHLLTCFKAELQNKERLAEIFKPQGIIFLDDVGDPTTKGLSNTAPLLGIKDESFIAEHQFSFQVQELINISLYIFLERYSHPENTLFSKGAGGYGIVTLADIVRREIEDENDWSVSGYSGPSIDYCHVTQIGGTERVRSEERPNLFRKQLVVTLHRIWNNLG